MKLRWVVALGAMLQAAAAMAAPLRNEFELRDGDGKLYATVVLCDDCKAPDLARGKPCDAGAVEGWVGGKPCGSCLMRANFGTMIRYPYDVAIVGKLVDKQGNPVKDRFLKLFMPNGWGVRTKSTDRGTFRMLLGATEPRKGDKPITLDLGERVDSISGVDEQFSLYLLPPGYAPCSGSEPDAPAPAKGGAQPAPKPQTK